MKTHSLWFLNVLLILISSCNRTLDKDSTSEIPQAISIFEQSMLDEINLARTDPATYAELNLKTEMLDSTDNGSYSYLKSLTPLSAVLFSNVLNLSASNYANFLADNNLIGHDCDGNPLKRAISAGYCGCMIGENIAACTSEDCDSKTDPKTASISFVKLMIIDQGVSDLGHRLTLLSKLYTTVGIGYCNNPSSTYINYNVQDFGTN